MWYNSALKNFTGTYIIPDDGISIDFIKWIRKNNPQSRIVFWFWNPITLVKKEHYLDILRENNCELWSYNILDCKKYGMNHNDTFYSENTYKDILGGETQVNYDLAFIGRDKGRLDMIYDLQKQKKFEGLKWMIYVTPDHYFQIFKKKEYSKYVREFKTFANHQITIKLQRQAKAVLEIIPNGYFYISERVMDSLNSSQKLVTNNKCIKQYDFYNKNNIYIIGDDERNVTEFLALPYEPIPKEIIDRYSVDSWINNFFIK